MAAPGIVINVQGGMIQDVYCSDEGIRVLVIDWDVESHDPGERDVVATRFGERSHNARVTEPCVHPLYELAGSDVEAAIDAACEAGVVQDVFA